MKTSMNLKKTFAAIALALNLAAPAAYALDYEGADEALKATNTETTAQGIQQQNPDHADSNSNTLGWALTAAFGVFSLLLLDAGKDSERKRILPDAPFQKPASKHAEGPA